MKRLLICLLTLTLFCFCGCKEQEDTKPSIDTAFETEINEICESIAKLDEEMNSIQPDTEQACSDMLNQLNSMEAAFEQFASLHYPEDFTYLKQYADEAKEYMTAAVSVYGEIYSQTEYDSEKDDYAKENYRRAFKRMQAILAVLRGEEPNK